MRKKKTFQIMANEGDAVIRLKSNKVIELVFAEDDETLLHEKEWHEQEVYKTAVQFALMIDTFFKNGEGLDNIIMHSPTGSIVAELLGKDMLSISLAKVDDLPGEDTEEELLEKIQEVEVVLEDNVVDASTRFKPRGKKDEDE